MRLRPNNETGWHISNKDKKKIVTGQVFGRPWLGTEVDLSAGLLVATGALLRATALDHSDGIFFRTTTGFIA